MTTIFFIRHGQTEWNKALRYQGHSDIALTPEGVQQADLVAKRLAKEPFDAIYSSDLVRARITAETIAAQHGLAVVTNPDFREVKFGEWEGLRYNEIYGGWPAEIDNFFQNPGKVCIPGGESFHEVKRRTDKALTEIRAKHEGECVAIVTHGGAIRTMLCSALGISLDLLWCFRQDNTAINIVEYEERYNILRLINDANHLYDFNSIDPARLPSYNINKRF